MDSGSCPTTTQRQLESKGEEINRRFEFWKERQIMKYKVADREADRIREQVAEVIPVVTKKQLAVMEADLRRIAANRRKW